MRVLITGGAGFIGSHLVDHLRARGDEVVVLDSFVPTYDLRRKEENVRASGLSEGAVGPARLVRGDLRDRALLDRLLPHVDAVVHLAALAGVRDSLDDPAAYVDVNIVGTQTLLDAMHAAGLRRLVFASSSSVYGARPDGDTFTEDDPADRPVSPYAATKRAGELLCHAAHAAWGLDVSCLRFFTVYGPRQRPAMAIARFTSLVLAGETLPLFGDGSSLRDYTFVGDAVRGIACALDRPQGFAVINLGCGSPIRLDDLVAAIGRAADRRVRVEHLPEQPGDVPRTHADISRAGALLDWRPQVALDEGLAAYLAWVRARDGV
ncbi:MAG: NAD-dependent epimerase/dehydratase family protein [Alphaproteobacteria bacterium]|nr:NAD-dependent epimerase/dehydratase family protein [Alphaproteobacteria bacterium]